MYILALRLTAALLDILRARRLEKERHGTPADRRIQLCQFRILEQLEHFYLAIQSTVVALASDPRSGALDPSGWLIGSID